MIAATDPTWYLLVAPCGLLVVVLGYLIRASRSLRRMHEAMFGYTEGSTSVPGVQSIIVGDGNGGSLSAIAKDARDTANGIAARQTFIEGEVDTIKDMATAAATLGSDNKATLEEMVTASSAASMAIDAHIADDLSIHRTQGVATAELIDKVDSVLEEVQTFNGVSAVLLAERAEGRRIDADIPPGDQTTSEKGYVDILKRGGRNIGHDAPEDRTVHGTETTPHTQAERDVE
jgi:hypothetical protein